jgi:hypothetical protein
MYGELANLHMRSSHEDENYKTLKDLVLLKPSTRITILKELKAKDPWTQPVLVSAFGKHMSYLWPYIFTLDQARLNIVVRVCDAATYDAPYYLFSLESGATKCTFGQWVGKLEEVSSDATVKQCLY